MIPGWAAVLTVLVYLCALFALAHYGDTAGRRWVAGRARPYIYALTLGVYCTSWTFFGSVGLASTRGLDFLPIYIGPALVIGLGYPLLLRIVRIAKAQNITSVADFVAARYGKSEAVAACVAFIALIGVVPYIALQLKAISSTLPTLLQAMEAGGTIVTLHGSAAVSLCIAALLAGFAMAFGTRHIEATEHQDGLVLAIAAESLVKLVAFLAVGAYVTWGVFDGFGDLATGVLERRDILDTLAQPPEPGYWAVTTLISACCIVLLPRQFHMAVVENRGERDVRTAAWAFPLYLVAINIFVVPLAVAGLLVFPDGGIDRDMTLLALPLHAGSGLMALVSVIGGLSAATAMVVVACVALSVMVSNDLMMPLILRARAPRRRIRPGDLGNLILIVRRFAILATVGLGWIYMRVSSEAALASIGLLSFAAIAQIAPAFVGGLFWRRATARGAMAGLVAGTLVWAYTLLLPSLDISPLGIAGLMQAGPLGILPLKPTALFGTDMPQLVHGVVWSLGVNVVCFVVFSLLRHTKPIERLQANVFMGSDQASMSQTFRLWRSSVPAGELETTIARYLGVEHTRREFESFLTSRGLDPKDRVQEADIHLLRFAEHLLASAVGAASSRLVLSLLLKRRNVSRDMALRMIDEASAAFQYNRDILQHALDFARQGITVFDRDLRLICWNREFRELFDLPSDHLRVGMGLDEILRFNARRGIYGPGPTDDYVAARLELLVNEHEPFRLRLAPHGRVVEIRSVQMPEGGLVTTYTDITDTVRAEEALERTNETLEMRVRQRTDELERLNAELARAKAEADDANLSKTRFLAAASHDLLQPLNAARLYATAMVERMQASADGSTPSELPSLVHNLDASLESVEEILTALLEISRLDAGAMKAEFRSFRLHELLAQLKIEFEPAARAKKLELVFVPSSVTIRSDRRLMRRLLQNLVSNAIKYTPKGRVLVGVRRHGKTARIEVWDTGLGIPASKQRDVFREFERLAPAAKSARGLGLGLSIVERISRVLDHRIDLRSTPQEGSVFMVDVPVVAEEPASAAVTDAAVPAADYLPLAGLEVVAIDNEPRILEGMQALLAGWGCRVVPAHGLAEAEAAFPDRATPPDVVVADYHLDEGDGIEAIAALRARFGVDLPAVLVTADRSPAMRERAGAADIKVLNKPLKPAALRALLAQWRVTRKAAE